MHLLLAAAEPWFGIHDLDLRLMILLWVFAPLLTVLFFVGLGKGLESLWNLCTRKKS